MELNRIIKEIVSDIASLREDVNPDYKKDLLGFVDEIMQLEARHAVTATNINQQIKSELDKAAGNLIEHLSPERDEE